jgi:hypothetical protein
MRAPTRLGTALLLALALALAALSSGCATNPESSLSVDEGQGMRLGDLLYNVQISRFLNPTDEEDKAYLVGQPPLASNEYYLGVFMQIQNEGDRAQRIPTGFTVVDTAGTKFKPLASKSLFALGLGTKVPADREVPPPDSTAANGPIQGSMVLFRIDGRAIQERPLDLRIPSSSGTVGVVELDI